MQKAVIDADFFIKLTVEEVSANLFLHIMNDLQMTPVMHEYVYKHELKHHSLIQNLVNQKKIEVYNCPNYLTTEQDKKEYEKYFRDAYEQLTSDPLPQDTNIYTYVADHEHLGEIRSIYLALKMGIPYFASDDRSARIFAKNYVSGSKHCLETFSVVDAIRKCRENGSSLGWRDFIRCIPAAYKNDRAKIDTIHNIFT